MEWCAGYGGEVINSDFYGKRSKLCLDFYGKRSKIGLKIYGKRSKLRPDLYGKRSYSKMNGYICINKSFIICYIEKSQNG